MSKLASVKISAKKTGPVRGTRRAQYPDWSWVGMKTGTELLRGQDASTCFRNMQPDREWVLDPLASQLRGEHPKHGRIWAILTGTRLGWDRAGGAVARCWDRAGGTVARMVAGGWALARWLVSRRAGARSGVKLRGSLGLVVGSLPWR